MSEKSRFEGKLVLSNGPLTTLELFYEEVCRRAENKMLQTGRLEGAHYASMREVLSELGILLDKAQEKESESDG